MKFIVRSGDSVSFLVSGSLEDLKNPHQALVQKVTEKALVVAEPYSVNGFASIICLPDSHRDGIYNYHYYRKFRSGDEECAILKLTSLRLNDGDDIKTKAFITDWRPS